MDRRVRELDASNGRKAVYDVVVMRTGEGGDGGAEGGDGAKDVMDSG